MFEVDEPHADRRFADPDLWRANICRQLKEGAARMDAMQVEIEANTQVTLALKDDTGELLDILNACRGGLKVLGWIGTAAKWLAGVAAAVGILYGLLHGGLPPK